ncbi:MAG: T9SS type A sorting domain-containing protein, partial [Bacteroidales bacterium]|nr:T9SS type A sorting domain-containing protein [Bacteroidales bacterium]
AAYVDIASNDIIPAMNGFMVQVVNPATTGSLTIPEASRIHSATWYKTNEGKILIIAKDEENNTAQQCVVKMKSQSTEGFDLGFDSHFLPGYAPMFYSMQGSDVLSTNTLPDLGDNRTVELGFIKNNASQFSLRLDQQNLIPDLKIYLTDKKLNREIDLLNQPVYNFTSEASDAADRFRLSFKRVISIPEPITAELLKLIVSDNTLKIISESSENLNLSIIDMSGRVIRTSELKPGFTELINLKGQPGVYVVKAFSAGSEFSGKVVIF